MPFFLAHIASLAASSTFLKSVEDEMTFYGQPPVSQSGGDNTRSGSGGARGFTTRGGSINPPTTPRPSSRHMTEEQISTAAREGWRTPYARRTRTPSFSETAAYMATPVRGDVLPESVGAMAERLERAMSPKLEREGEAELPSSVLGGMGRGDGLVWSGHDGGFGGGGGRSGRGLAGVGVSGGEEGEEGQWEGEWLFVVVLGQRLCLRGGGVGPVLVELHFAYGLVLVLLTKIPLSFWW
ncbi:hypothetical protein KVT40_006172 [Elsinoe batatas]|uniref:Uncharacterized protein n=1 Tax=Elsinoe batatas TaxID=2601811 RepID=A0A8K0PDJ4_9PEZI|nr:hypothetical protein KVT40_006172 [Elsinoe batatas]